MSRNIRYKTRRVVRNLCKYDYENCVGFKRRKHILNKICENLETMTGECKKAENNQYRSLGEIYIKLREPTEGPVLHREIEDLQTGKIIYVKSSLLSEKRAKYRRALNYG